MVNTLRITSVVAVLVAVVLLILIAGPKSLAPKLLAKLALGSDEEVERILNAPSVVDRFAENQGDQSKPDVTPALVKQAEILANILNPPEPVPPPIGDKNVRTKPGRTPLRPPVTSAKFDLVGTTYLASDPEMSFAYIRLPDNTQQWLRKGDEVGHLKVTEIRSGSIVYWDGQKEVELAAEPVPETASVLEAGAASSVGSEQAEPVSVPLAGERITGPPVPRPWRPSRATTAPNEEIDAVERARMEELVSRIKESNGAGSAQSPAERAAMVKKLMAEFKGESRVTPEEAEDVEDLGRELNESQKAPPNQRRTNLRRKLNIPRLPKK
ncbi:MAG: hypothetical protein JSW27_12560 [Phycisphaerales bacterium]|nr:MAG: hypothetical protein JSW27_12560 [Phycisphaerales bacterium]